MKPIYTRDDSFVRLEYSPRNVVAIQARHGERLELATSTGPCFLFFYRTDTVTASVTLGYIRQLARDGYVGLQRIPRWAVKR